MNLLFSHQKKLNIAQIIILFLSQNHYYTMSQLKSPTKSPLRRAQSIMSATSSSPGLESKLKTKRQIQNLLTKFIEINNNIQIEADQTNLNLIQYQKENEKIKFDPQMMTAKLRSLENRAQINRAKMELQNRQKKFKKKGKAFEEGESYQQIYKDYLKNRKLSNQYTQISDQDSVDGQHDSKNIAYLGQLKRHPRLLQYTLGKLENKEKQEQQKSRFFEKMVQEHHKNKNLCSNDYMQLMNEVEKRQSMSMTYNPQNVLDNQAGKFFTKKNTQKVNKDVSSLPRCSRMIKRQNQILSEIDDKSLSKQNKKKLKNRLNEIIVSLGKSQKMSKNFALPKISTARAK